jgi:hypothetical protein
MGNLSRRFVAAKLCEDGNKETRNAGEKLVYGFLDSLLKATVAVLLLVY